MHKLTKRSVIAKIGVAGMLGMASMTALADTTLTYSNPGKADENMQLSVVNNRAAMQFTDGSGDSSRMIFDKAENKMYMVMDSQKQYIDMDVMMEALGGLSGMLSGMMKDLPEDAQGQLGDLLGGLMGNKEEPAAVADPVLKESGKNDSIAGFDCALATLETPTQSTELCLAKPGKVGVNEADFSVLQAMLKKQRESADKAASVLGIPDIGFNPGSFDRLPLRIKQLSGEGAGSVSELQSVQAQANADSVAIPADYTVASMPGLQ